MSSAGETSRARNLVSVRQRKKKQFRRGAARSITSRPDAHPAKQMTAACAVIGNWRNRSISFIALPGGKSGSTDLKAYSRSSLIAHLLLNSKSHLQQAQCRGCETAKIQTDRDHRI